MVREEWTPKTLPEGFPPETRATEFVAFNEDGMEVPPDSDDAVRAAVSYFNEDGGLILISDMVTEREQPD